MVYKPAVFTGLVQTVGEVVGVRPGPDKRTFTVAADLDPRDLEIGASVCCDGVCLTVTRAEPGRFEVDAAFETLAKTTLGDKKAGDGLNLEPSLRVGDALGGHLVSGHVDGVATVRSRTARGDAVEFWFTPPKELLPLIAPKGSVAIEGVSLTVNAVDDTAFMVGLIPHTLAVTTLGRLSVGDRVNIEADVVARYVARLLTAGDTSGGVTLELLARQGFVRSGES